MRIFIALFIALAMPISSPAQTTAFSYQGHLNNAGIPANGNFEMQFKLFDALAGGAQVGGTVTDSNVVVANGSFVSTLDFGAPAFLGGPASYLEIGVRPMGNPAPFTILTPLQQIKATPYSIQARNALTADNATNALQLGGIAAGQYLQSGQTVTSLNTLKDNVTLAAGTNITITPAGGTLTIASTSGGVGGSGTVNSIPVWSAGSTLGNSLITQSVNGVQLPNTVQFAAGAQGNQVSFGSPNGETGMSIAGSSGRADVRFDGTTLRLLAGPAGSPPSNGIAVTPSLVQLPNSVQLATGSQGNHVAFGSPNSETGMSISGATGRADVRFDGTTLRLLSGPAGGPPSNGLAISPSGNVTQNEFGRGLVKAMLRVNSSGAILSCYNGYTNNSAGNCGFTVTHTGLGNYDVYFGQPVFGTFASVEEYDGVGIGATHGFYGSGTMYVRTFATDGAQPANRLDWSFTVIMF